ncbi:MAG: sulfatase-like hydrolase/transferase [Pseudomonadota bacterium]
MEVRHSKKNLLRWCGWFLLYNTFLFYIISLKFLPSVFPGEFYGLSFYGKCLVGGFIFVTYISFLAFLALLPALIIVPAILIIPWRRAVFFIAIFLLSILACYLYFDAVIYNLYRFHLHGFFLNVAVNQLKPEVFGFSNIEYWISVGIVSGIFLLEWVGACAVWNTVICKNRGRGVGLWSVMLIAGCGYISYSLVAFSGPYPVGRVFMDNARFLPFYHNLLMPSQQGLIAIQRKAERDFLQPPQMSGALHYPLQNNLQCQPQKQPLNLLIIVVDAWRFDMLTKEVTPTLFNFAKTNWTFTQHTSGGNATGPGIFSLMYGLPATYWTAMADSRHGPVLIDELLNQHYQMGIFSSPTLLQPAFDKTVFSSIKHLRLGTPGAKDAHGRDQIITQEFKKFLEQAATKPEPFFGFLFYNSSHSYCEINDNLKPFVPVSSSCDRFQLSSHANPLPYLNRYKNALLLVDQQVQQVLAALASQKLLDKTIVVITGDHGEEFNDNGLGYWGHASNFTRYQVQTPLIVHWPKKAAHVFNHRTSHFDIAPTLVADMLGCHAPAAAYSVGMNLKNTGARKYFMIGSYIDFGMVEPDRITTIYPLGNYSIDNPSGQPQVGATLRMATMQEMITELKEFYQQKT